jgi:flagellar basal-body rod protein FlgC
MMDYFSIFDISSVGMSVQKTRVDVVALNLANSETTRTAEGGPYKPLEVVISEAIGGESFSNMVKQHSASGLYGSVVTQLRPIENPTKAVYKPNHPDADADGIVQYPNVDPASQMVNLLEATRAYEANVKALNASISLAQAALEIGR